MYRVDSARDRSAGGTGLGLAIVKGLVDALDARIDVQSTPGEGSTFRVLLPLEVAAA
jgi:two-component system phosphate regulon sensor histidine kinase PhoR